MRFKAQISDSFKKVVAVVRQSEETGVLPPGNQRESSPLTAAQNCMSTLKKKTSSKIMIKKNAIELVVTCLADLTGPAEHYK